MKKEWSEPTLKKMDVEETAIGPGVGLDGEVGS
jgi:hypothetical protein